MRACPPDNVLDLDSGSCLPPGAMRSLARAQGIGTEDDSTFTCAPDASLVASGQALRCLPLAAICPRGWRWNTDEKRCARLRSCAAGELADPVRDRCARVIAPAGDRDVIDVGAWIALAIGPYGGNGSPDFCGMLARTPGQLGRTTVTTLRIDIAIDFPDNDANAAHIRFRASEAPAGPLLSGQAERAVERAITSSLDPLRTMGGDTSSSTVETSVVCAVGDAGVPVAGR
ncbi:hypothetical protein [Pendulispora albinea]|uniref:Uncharacterized protein n=1 Tax=Pendulispora albinea TaxID=2741071 RepID=A0ABZ2M4G6_9BACT